MTSLVSVIIPVYNVVTYLEKCVNSIRKQSYQNLEILLIDDGSTDGSGVLCDELASQDDRIIVLHKANAGLSEARNDGIKCSRGDYLYFIDSDDYLIDKQTIEKMVLGAIEFGVSIVVAAYQRVENNFVNHCVKIELMPEPTVYQATDMIAKLYQYDCFSGNFIVVHNKLYKRNLFDDCLFPSGRIHEDEFVIYKLYLKAGQILWLPYETYAYRMRDNSIMRSAYSLRRLDIIDAYEERVEVLKAYGLPIKETVYQLITKLSYHRWCLLQYGFYLEERILSDKMKVYYQIYSNKYSGKTLLQLRLMRYMNSTYRFVYHNCYERLVRLSLRLRRLVRNSRLKEV